MSIHAFVCYTNIRSFSVFRQIIVITQLCWTLNGGGLGHLPYIALGKYDCTKVS